MIGQMAIAAALPGFNDLGRSVTPTFLCRNRFYSQLSTQYPKLNKESMCEVKKIQDLCPWDIESCHLAAARSVKLWSLNTNLFFKEPHHLIGPLEQCLAKNISLQKSNYIISGLTDIMALFANEARFFRFRVFFRACSLLNKVGDPPFFLHF